MAAASCALRHEGKRMNGSKVLIADNEPTHARVIGINLTLSGYEVDFARDGADAVRRAKEWRPNVLILDLLMPQLDGWEVIREIRSQDETRDIPVLMLTGLRRDLADEFPHSHEPDHFMTKPFDLDQLESMVAKLAARGGATAN
jgi:CheY-like chemotaxis protein